MFVVWWPQARAVYLKPGRIDALDLTFTFTPTGGPSRSFVQQDSRQTGKTKTTCPIAGSQSDPAGDRSPARSALAQLRRHR